MALRDSIARRAHSSVERKGAGAGGRSASGAPSRPGGWATSSPWVSGSRSGSATRMAARTMVSTSTSSPTRLSRATRPSAAGHTVRHATSARSTPRGSSRTLADDRGDADVTRNGRELRGPLFHGSGSERRSRSHGRGGVYSQLGWAPGRRPMRACVGGTETLAVMLVRKRASAVAEIRPRAWTKERSILSRLGGVPSLKLALWPTVPAEEAVVRRRATSATRQRTIEAYGTDRGASCARSGPGCGERPGDSVLWVLVAAGSDAGARVDDRQAFTPVVHVGDEGTVTVTFYDFRNNTAADGMLATDQWAVRCRPASEDCSRSAGWNEETRATPGDSGRLGCALGPGPGSIPSAECARPRRLGRPPPTRRAVAFASPLPIFAVGLVLLRLGTGSPQRPSRGRLASMAPRALDRARQPQPRSLNARLHLLRSCGHVRASGGLFSTPGLDEWRPSVRRSPSAAAGLSCFARMPRGT
jgi:hypothetical protein